MGDTHTPQKEPGNENEDIRLILSTTHDPISTNCSCLKRTDQTIPHLIGYVSSMEGMKTGNPVLICTRCGSKRRIGDDIAEHNQGWYDGMYSLMTPETSTMCYSMMNHLLGKAVFEPGTKLVFEITQRVFDLLESEALLNDSENEIKTFISGRDGQEISIVVSTEKHYPHIILRPIKP